MKIKINILLLTLISLLSSCQVSDNSSHKETLDTSLYIEETGYGETDLQNPRGVLDEPYFKLIDGDKGKSYYYIYNEYGEILDEGENDRALPDFQMIDENTVEYSIGMGTGITLRRYYNVKTNQISKLFDYAYAYKNGLIAYIQFGQNPNVNIFDDRILVVTNVFNAADYYKEIPLKFSKTDTPILEAEFTDDTHLKITYLSGDDFEEVTEVLDLNNVGIK